jgi:hypothetical protein
VNSTLQVLLPLFTLIIGYLLNIIASSIESQRSEKKRRIFDKEQAYAKISAKLHDLFETYRILTLNANLDRIPLHSHNNSSEDITFTSKKYETLAYFEPLRAKYNELRILVFNNSLYLKPNIIQKLVDLQLIDFRGKVDFIFKSIDKDPIETIQFEEQHVDQLWSQAKEIMNEMRLELGLDPYPDSILKILR